MKKEVFIFILLLVVLPFTLAQTQKVLIKEIPKNSKYSTFSIESTPLQEVKIIHNYGEYKLAELTEKEISQLKQNPNLEIIKTKEIPTKALLQDAVNITKANQVWNQIINGTNITGINQTTCVLDTGINFNHPDLEGKNKTCNIDCVNKDCIEDCSVLDDNGHGTHVAGIVAANGGIKGIAPDSKLIGVKVLNSTGQGTLGDIIKGIDWCQKNSQTYGIKVISISIGSDVQFNDVCDDLDTDLTNNITAATNENISVVVATGNEHNYTGISLPACVSKTFKVGATDKSDIISSITNRGTNFPNILLAPGININSTSSSLGYIIESGTSMSTPMVSGIISLINNYKEVESNKRLTPDSIKQILVDSGKKIYDSQTGLNYSRVDGYNAILSIDEQAPNITYFSPNQSLIEETNINFSCNAIDALQFSNITIKIENSSGLIYNITSTNESTKINKTLSRGTYNWSCIAKDNKSNTQIKTESFEIDSLTTKINSPKNNSYTNSTQTEFNCSAESTTNLTNMTFSIYNETKLLFNQTKNLSGKINSTIFSFNLTNETNYFFDCQVYNNQSEIRKTQNYTITYDNTLPKITIISPQNNTRTQTKTITFSYQENETNPDYCNLSINDQIKNSFTQTLSDGNYNWKIICTDKAGNSNYSQTNNLEIYTTHSSSSGGSSSSSSSTSATSNTPTIQVNKTIQKDNSTQTKINDTKNIPVHAQENSTTNKIPERKTNTIIEKIYKFLEKILSLLKFI